MTNTNTAVRTLMAELEQFGGGGQWVNTGGGCHAIELALPDGGYLSITDAEDVFFENDIDSDDDVAGFCVTRYDADHEPVEPKSMVGQYHYLSDIGAEGYELGHDIPHVVEVVRAVLDGRI